MEATCTPIALAGPTRRRARLGRLVRATCLALAEVLAEGARGNDFERAFRSAPGAEFAALPDSVKRRMLDRGIRP